MFTFIKNYKKLFSFFIKNEFAFVGLSDFSDYSDMTSETKEEVDFSKGELEDLKQLRKLIDNGLTGEEVEKIAKSIDLIDGKAKEGLMELGEAILEESFSVRDEATYNSYKTIIEKSKNVQIPTWNEIRSHVNKKLSGTYDVVNGTFDANDFGSYFKGLEIKGNEIKIRHKQSTFSFDNTLKGTFDNKTGEIGETEWISEKSEGSKYNENPGEIKKDILDDNISNLEQVEQAEQVNINEKKKEIQKFLVENVDLLSADQKVALSDLIGSLSLDNFDTSLFEEIKTYVATKIKEKTERESNVKEKVDSIVKELKDFLSKNEKLLTKEQKSIINKLISSTTVENYGSDEHRDLIKQFIKIKYKVESGVETKTVEKVDTATEIKETERKARVNAAIKKYRGDNLEGAGTKGDKIETKYEKNADIKKLYETTINVSTKTPIEEIITFEKAMNKVDSEEVKEEMKEEMKEEEDNIIDDTVEWTKEKYTQAVEWIKELFDNENLEGAGFIGINGEKVEMEFDEATGRISYDTSFSDGIGDFDFNSEKITNINTKEEAKEYVGKEMKKIKNAYNEKVIENAKKVVTKVPKKGEPKTAQRTINVFKEGDKILDVRLVRTQNGKILLKAGSTWSRESVSITKEELNDNIILAQKIKEAKLKYRKSLKK